MSDSTAYRPNPALDLILGCPAHARTSPRAQTRFARAVSAPGRHRAPGDGSRQAAGNAGVPRPTPLRRGALGARARALQRRTQARRRPDAPRSFDAIGRGRAEPGRAPSDTEA